MTDITETPLASLDTEGRLLSPVFKGETKPGHFGFRGEIALKFAQQFSDEARPPEIRFDQVMIVAQAGETTIPFLAGVALSLEHLKLLCEVLGDKLSPTGKYFFFAGNLDISRRYQIAYGGATFWVLPLEERRSTTSCGTCSTSTAATSKSSTPPASCRSWPMPRPASPKSSRRSVSRRA
jgi:hypothetical protein